MWKRVGTMQWTRGCRVHAVAICMLIGAQAAKAQSGGPLRLRSNISQSIAAATLFTAATVREVDQRQTITMPPINPDTQTPRHTGRDILLGALIGGTLLGGVELNHARHCVDCYFTGPAVTAAFGVGAVGGALLGWVASNI
jgi:hypothetical protein